MRCVVARNNLNDLARFLREGNMVYLTVKVFSNLFRRKPLGLCFREVQSVGVGYARIFQMNERHLGRSPTDARALWGFGQSRQWRL